MPGCAAMPAWQRLRPGRTHRRLPRGPGAHQQGEFRDRLHGDAHDRPGLDDGVPGRRTACAGPRSRGGRLCVPRDELHSTDGALGEAARQEPADRDGEALRGRRARRCPGDRLRHVSDLEHLSGTVCRAGDRQSGHRETASECNPSRSDQRAHHPRGPERERYRSESASRLPSPTIRRSRRRWRPIRR